MTRLLVSCRFAPYSETRRLAVRHGVDVADVDAVWRESFGPFCWLADGQGATVQFGYDSDVIGQVVAVAASGRYYYADLVVDTEDAEVLERIKVGTPLSLGARSIHRDENLDIHVRRHRLAQLEHIAIARHGERGKYPCARITSVRESKTAATSSAPSAVDWRSSVPPGHEHLLEGSYQPQLGDELLAGTRHDSPATHRFDGQKFVALGRQRIAA